MMHLRPRSRLDLGLLVVGRVVVRGPGRELGRAGVDGLVDRPDRPGPAGRRGPPPREGRGSRRSDCPRTRAAWPAAPGRGSMHRRLADLLGDLVEQRDLVEEPRVDRPWPACACSTVAPPHRACCTSRSRPSRGTAARSSSAAGSAGGAPAHENWASLLLQGAQRLLQRLGEVAADGHGLADALHRGREPVVGVRELLEREAGHLDHDVVQGGLEAGGRLRGDVVGDLVEASSPPPAGRRSWRSGIRWPCWPAHWTARPAGSSR